MHKEKIYYYSSNKSSAFTHITGAPCGACRELMVQLMPNGYQEIEVLMDFDADVPTVPLARYCKRSFGFAQLLSLNGDSKNF